MDVSKRLSELMGQQGYSASALAKQTGVSQTMISAVLRGAHAPSVQTLELICSGLQMTLAEFFMKDEKAPPPEQGAQEIRRVLEESGIIKPGQQLSNAQVDALIEFAEANSEFIRARADQIEQGNK